MAKLGISTGTIPNDGTGDSLLAAGVKINSNFNEIYTLLGDGSTLTTGIVTSIVAGSGITISGSTGRVTVQVEASISGAAGTWATTSVGIHTLKNVGIGTTNPTQRLSVSGNVFATDFIGLGVAPSYPVHVRSNQSSATDPSVVISPFSTTRTAAIRLTNGSQSNFVLGLQNSSGNGDLLSFPAYSGVVGLSSNNPLIFVTNGIEGFRLAENGNLGLNRNSPTSKLDVFGDARISGVVTAASFVGSGVGLTGVSANYTSTAGVATYAVNAGVATYAANSGYSTTAGIANTAVTLDITNTNGLTNTYYPTFVEFRTNGQYVRADVDLTYRTDTNTLTAGTFVGSGASLAQLAVSGVSTFNDQVDIYSNISIQGSVGINTTIYDSTFVIASAGESSSELMCLDGISNNNRYGLFSQYGSETTITSRDGNNYGTIKLNQYDGSTVQTSIIIPPSGNIGIGTTIPTSKLTVKGTTSLETLNVSGISTLNQASISNAIVSGVATVGVLTATSLYGDASYTVSGKWTVTGDGYNFAFVGVGLSISTNDPVLYFARGCTYHIVNNAPDHPLEIRDQENGFAYNNGVVGNGQTMTTIKFTVPLDAPNTLYYQCTDHAGMGNTIRIYPDRI